MIKIDKPLILAFTTWWSSHQIRVSARRICNCLSKDPTWYLYGWFSLPELLLVFGQSFDGPTLSRLQWYGSLNSLILQENRWHWWHQISPDSHTSNLLHAGDAKICQVAWHTSSPLTSCQHRFLMSFLSENVAKMLIDPWSFMNWVRHSGTQFSDKPSDSMRWVPWRLELTSHWLHVPYDTESVHSRGVPWVKKKHLWRIMRRIRGIWNLETFTKLYKNQRPSGLISFSSSQ